MITGAVNEHHEITVWAPIRNASGRVEEIEVILDTGFTGSLTLPPAVVAALGLPWRSRGHTMLASGEVEQFDLHAATVVWDGNPRQVLVQAIDTTPLLGMGLLIGYDLRARVRVGGSVEIEAIH